MSTKIEWTDETWNPVTGCTKVSAGCKNCYAERIAERFWGERKFTDVICHDDRLDIPLKWRKPRRVFVNSMSDLFHPDVPWSFVSRAWSVMRKTPQHTYQILTKRPEWMFRFITEYLPQPPFYKLPENVWLGVSCENQDTADERIPWLLNTPAAIRFVSYEPALGPVNFCFTALIPYRISGGRTLAIDGIDWLIAGGESGPGARPAHPDWFRSVRDQCVAAGVPFFFKQWGEWWPGEFGRLYKAPVKSFSDGQDMWRVGKEKAGRELDGIVWNEYPEAR